jgi:anti-sigma factor RsiW
MKCPHCDRMNFNWASRCDHCGRRLADRPEAIERPVVAAAPDASHSWVEDDKRQNREFIQALSARTPRIIATPALIALNVAVFPAMAASGLSPTRPLPDALIRWGAEYGPLTTPPAASRAWCGTRSRLLRAPPAPSSACTADC